MSVIIAVYSKKIYKDFILPSLDNTDNVMLLGKCEFGLENDLKIYFEDLNGTWKIKSDVHYWIFSQDRTPYYGDILKDGDVFYVDCGNREKITLIIKEVSQIIRAYDKYDIANTKQIVIGKSVNSDIVYNYKNMVSSQHTFLEKRNDKFRIVNKSSNGTYVNAKRIDEENELEYGDRINIMGLHMVFLGEILAIDHNEDIKMINKNKMRPYVEDMDMTVCLIEQRKRNREEKIYHRAPRNYSKLNQEVIEIQNISEKTGQDPNEVVWMLIPVLTTMMSMILGCLLMISSTQVSGKLSDSIFFMGIFIAFLSVFCGMIWEFVNIYLKRNKCKIEKQKRYHSYINYLSEKEAEIKEKYENNRNILEAMYPSPTECVRYNESDGFLWNRNIVYEDFLVHRLGIGDFPFQSTIVIPKEELLLQEEVMNRPQLIKERYGMLNQVPITVDFAKYNRIGIVGGKGRKGALELARVISAQIAANNCYTDVKMGFFYHQEISEEREAFHFAKWLPHVWSQNRKIRFVASNKEEASDVFYELTEIFRARNQKQEKKDVSKPYYILFLTDDSILDENLFAKYVFGESASLGLTTILLAERYVDLPHTCEFIIENSDAFSGMYNVVKQKGKETKITFDTVGEKQLMQFAQSLSRIKVQQIEKGERLPTNLSFLEMLDIPNLDELSIRNIWAKSYIYENIRGVIGRKVDGKLCYLDIHEKYHGPHGLVVGTTGSGKSEILKTFLLSLALQYSPEDIGFFVIDFKGGGMEQELTGLPHMLGQISNLSGGQIKRALISVKSEIRRRQKLFYEIGVNHINDYIQFYKRGEVSVSIPHLLLIVDEFAELKKEEPDFMKELISIAQIGRSLGIHLILATQRPSGIVDDNILSNSKFRICLRVQNKIDSQEVIHRSDAAYITQPGCGYLQVGNDEIYELFQSGYSGARYQEKMEKNFDVHTKLLKLNGKVELDGKITGKFYEGEKQKQITQLDAVKRHIHKAASEIGFRKSSPLWMPVLSNEIYLDSIEEFQKKKFTSGIWRDNSIFDSIEVVVGMVDDPEQQRQIALNVDFLSGHIVVCGSATCGKSTMMQTMMYALISKYTPEQINIYGLDFNGGMMHAFENAPQIGDILYEDDMDKMAKFIAMMKKILENRKKCFHGGNYRQYVKVNGKIVPMILIFIDSYASWKEKTEAVYEKDLIRFAKEGIKYGICFIISGFGFHTNDIPLQFAETIGKILCLDLPDRYAYASLLHNYQVDLLPERGIRGRGLTVVEKRVLEYQTALCKKAETDYDRLEKIRNVCTQMSEAWCGKRADKIPEIPQNLTWSQFEQHVDFNHEIKNAEVLPVGYDCVDASIYGIYLKKTYCYLIWGTAKSGKTNFMKVCIQAALKRKGQICIIDSPKGELKQYQMYEDVCYVTKEQDIFHYFEALVPELKQRNEKKQALQKMGYHEDEIFKQMSKEKPYFIFLSDLDWFIPFLYHAELEMKGFLEHIIENGKLHNIYFIGELSLEKLKYVSGYPLYELFASHKTGIQFGGKLLDNPALSFDYLSVSEQMKITDRGIGQILDQEEWQNTRQVTVPLVTGG